VFKIDEYSSQASSLKPLHGCSIACIHRTVHLSEYIRLYNSITDIEVKENGMDCTRREQ
jgi:hypothetical protein